MAKTPTKLGILVSGRGSNMQSLVRACAEGHVPAEVTLVVSNRPSAAGIAWADNHGIPTSVLSHRDFSSREAHDAAVVEALHGAGVEWVCLAGYMRLLSSVFVEAYTQRILNIHPSLLPAFPGLHAQQQALDYGVRWTGCTVHFVDLELDHGPIVVQRAVPVGDCDDIEALERRILAEEHRAYPEALALLLGRSWKIDGRRVRFPALNSIDS